MNNTLYIFNENAFFDFVPIGKIKQIDLQTTRDIIESEIGLCVPEKIFIQGKETHKINLEIQIQSTKVEELLNDSFSNGCLSFFKIQIDSLILRYKGRIEQINVTINAHNYMYFNLCILVDGFIISESNDVFHNINNMSIFEIMTYVNNRLKQNKEN